MALIFLSVLLALCSHPILHFILPEIKFQSLGAEHLPPEEANLDAEDFGEIIVTSVPVSTKPSISMSFIYFSFVILSFFF